MSEAVPVLRRITLQVAARCIAPGTCFVILLALCSSALAQSPQRIVSLNICTDELLLRLVPPARIVSVTWLARDPNVSDVTALAKSVPVNHGSAEEVIPSMPDLVLAGQYTTIAATSLLERTGFRVVRFPIVRNLAGVRDEIGRFGKLVDAEPAANAMIAQIEAALQPAPPPGVRRPRALVLNPNGVTVGPNTLADAVMTHAGLDNIAATLSLGGYNQVPLELLASLDVDVLVISGAERDAPSLATDVLRHPVLQKLRERMVIVDLPGRLWSCAGPGLIEAVARLRAAADEARARGAHH